MISLDTVEVGGSKPPGPTIHMLQAPSITSYQYL